MQREENDFQVLISERQECIRSIDAVNRSMDRIAPGGVKALLEMPAKLKGLIESHINNLKTAIQAAALADRKLLALVKVESTHARSELLAIQNVRQAARGYGGERMRSPRFINTMR